MTLLNLGCGTKTSSGPGVVNIDWSIHLRVRKAPALRIVAPLLFTGERRKGFDSLPDNILVHDFSKGIPYETGSVDAVYHSHLLEHIDRDRVGGFLAECHRVLKPGGIHRIVLPDLEKICRDYLSHLDQCGLSPALRGEHDGYVAALIEQSVRREASGTSRQKSVRRFLENLFLGDARKRGHTHQWLYDRINLAALLEKAGFREAVPMEFDSSRIPEWNGYGLDQDGNGGPYKPGSLYMEAVK